MDSKHFISDLKQLIRQKREDRVELIKQIRAIGVAITPEQESLSTLRYNMLGNLILDLQTMVTAWEKDFPAFRVTEEMIAAEELAAETHPCKDTGHTCEAGFECCIADGGHCVKGA